MANKFDFKKINWGAAMIMYVLIVLLSPGLILNLGGPGKMFGFDSRSLLPAVIHGAIIVLAYELISQLAGYQTTKA